MAGFVKTEKELDRIAAVLSPMRYLIDEVAVGFQTTWEFARSVLPPCLEPIGDRGKNVAEAVASVLSLECPHFDRFDADHVSLLCKYGDVEGGYIIHSVHSNEAHVICGREVWGGPKKLGNARVFHDGTHHYGYSERNSVRLVEIAVETEGPALGPQTSESKAFSVKMVPHVSGRGLQYPPLLCIWDCREKVISKREGRASLKWGHSTRDPVDTIPIVSVGAGHVLTGEFAYLGVKTRELQDPDGVYARYLWGTFMDDATSFDIPTRWKKEIEVNS
jgi:acetoacetate decarboxylase